MLENNYTPLVSIFMITYNHEKYISQALDSILMQVVNFDYEIVVGEDCSTDSTRKILLEYQTVHPDKLKLLLHKSNIGAISNQITTMNACIGKYIAILEGDDYWTDSHKLQKQVDFLEANPEYSLSFHNAKIISANSERIYHASPIKSCLKIEDLLSYYGNMIPTASIVFKTKYIQQYIDIIKNQYIGDWYVQIIFSQHGNFKYHDEVMSAYRMYNSGVWSKLDLIQKNIVFYTYYKHVYSYFKEKKTYQKLIKPHLKKITWILLKSYIKNIDFKKSVFYFSENLKFNI